MDLIKNISKNNPSSAYCKEGSEKSYVIFVQSLLGKIPSTQKIKFMPR